MYMLLYAYGTVHDSRATHIVTQPSILCVYSFMVTKQQHTTTAKTKKKKETKQK